MIKMTLLLLKMLPVEVGEAVEVGVVEEDFLIPLNIIMVKKILLILSILSMKVMKVYYPHLMNGPT